MFRIFVPNFARIASPSPRCLKKAQAKYLGSLEEDELKALATLKEKLTSSQVISLPKRNGHYTLDRDACHKKVECVLLQDQEDRKTP